MERHIPIRSKRFTKIKQTIRTSIQRLQNTQLRTSNRNKRIKLKVFTQMTKLRLSSKLKDIDKPSNLIASRHKISKKDIETYYQLTPNEEEEEYNE